VPISPARVTCRRISSQNAYQLGQFAHSYSYSSFQSSQIYDSKLNANRPVEPRQIGAAPELRVVFSSGLFIFNFYMIVSFIFTAFEPFYKEFEEENSKENIKQID